MSSCGEPPPSVVPPAPDSLDPTLRSEPKPSCSSEGSVRSKLKPEWSAFLKDQAASKNKRQASASASSSRNWKGNKAIKHVCIKCLKEGKPAQNYTLCNNFTSSIVRHLGTHRSKQSLTVDKAAKFIMPLKSPMVESILKTLQNVSQPPKLTKSDKKSKEKVFATNISSFASSSKSDSTDLELVDISDGTTAKTHTICAQTVLDDSEKAIAINKTKVFPSTSSPIKVVAPTATGVSHNSSYSHSGIGDDLEYVMSVFSTLHEYSIDDVQISGATSPTITNPSEKKVNLVNPAQSVYPIIDMLNTPIREMGTTVQKNAVDATEQFDGTGNESLKQPSLDLFFRESSKVSSGADVDSTVSQNSLQTQVLAKLDLLMRNHNVSLQDRGHPPETASTQLSRISSEYPLLSDLKTCENLTEVMNAGVIFSTEQTNGDVILQCSLCKAYLENNPHVKASKISSLCTGCALPAIGESESYQSQERRGSEVMKTIIGLGVLLAKEKSSGQSFEDFLFFLSSRNIDVGDISHGRHIFLSILRAAASEIYAAIRNKICEPLEATGLPPFLMIIADKATINMRSNQTILACSSITGLRTSLPVGSPLVYDGGDGGTAEELANQICDTFVKNYRLPESHLQMIAGFAFDGQYMKESMVETLKGRVLGPEASKSTNIFSVPVNWDGSHLLNLTIVDIREGKGEYAESGEHFRRFISRSNCFADSMKWGKGYAVLEKTAKDNNLPKYAPVTYAQQRFTSSALSQWTTIYKGYGAFCATFDALNPNCSEDEELQYKMKGQDYVLDLLSMLDVLEPLKLGMEAVQGVSAAPWKTAKVYHRLMEHYETMDFSSLQHTPRLQQHLAEVKEMTFKGVTLNVGYLMVKKSTEHKENVLLVGSSSRGTTKTRKQKEEVFDWISREIDDVMNDNQKLVEDIKLSLRSRFEKCVHPSMKDLLNCVDFHDWVKLLAGVSSETGCPYNKVEYQLHGEEIFQRLVEAVADLPVVKNSGMQFDKRMASRYFDTLKTVVASAVWGDMFPLVGVEMFTVVEGPSAGKLLRDVVEEDSVFRLTTLVSSEFQLDERFQVELRSKTSYIVKFEENHLLKAFYLCQPLFSQVGKEACLVLDFAWNLGGTVAMAESYFNVMATQRKDGGQNNSTLELRTLLDFSLPHPSNCPDMISKISQTYLKGNPEQNLDKHGLPIFFAEQNRAVGKYRISKVMDRKASEKKGLSFIK